MGYGSFLWDLWVILTAVLAVGYAYFWWRFQYWKRRNIPYLEPVIPWGSLGSPFTRKTYIGDDLMGLYKEGKVRGWKYFGIFFVNQANLVITDLGLVKQIMAKDFSNFVDRGLYTNEKDDPLSGHLFALGGTKWRNLRVKLSPTFTSGKLKSMFSTLVDCGLVLEKYLESNIKTGEAVDIKEVLGKFSTDIIGSCAFGLECNSFKDPDSPFRKYGRRVFEVTKLDNIKFAIGNSYPKIGRALGITTTPPEVSEFMYKIVNDTVSYRKKNNYSRNDFLQLLIEIMDNKQGEHKGDGSTLTMDEVTAQCFVFFLAGFETSSTTMTFVLYHMAIHQDIQDRVREEIKTVLGRHENKVTYDSLSELKYMRQVIDETLRLFPPVPFVTRCAAKDYKIPGEDTVIEAGTSTFIPIIGIHRDEEYYENPMEFNPDRFSDENKANIPQYAHIPFGEGPRICIGERFGIMQTKVGLTSVLRNFRVKLNKKTQLPLKMELEPLIPTVEGGLWLDFEQL